jgi:hypothetical protein
MTQLRALHGIIAVGVAAVFLSPACSSEPERPPFASDGSANGGAFSPGGAGESGGEGGEVSIGGRKSSGGRSGSSQGGAPSAGGAASGGAETGGASFSIVRVSRFNEDYSTSTSHWSGSGTVSSYVGGAWIDTSYTGEPVAVPPSAAAYRVTPRGNDTDMTTFTVSVPPRELTALGLQRRSDLDLAFAQLQVFAEPNEEEAQMVVFVHDQFGQPIEDAVPETPDARVLAFYRFEVWDDLAEQTSETGLFLAGNVNGSQFQSGGYAFVVTAFNQSHQVSVPMTADALTFVDLELARP